MHPATGHSTPLSDHLREASTESVMSIVLLPNQPVTFPFRVCQLESQVM